jgi:hypothetical protein
MLHRTVRRFQTWGEVNQMPDRERLRDARWWV